MIPIDCGTAREQMLEADIEELRGTAATPLAAHIASCRDCAAAAAQVLRGYERLDAGLREMTRSKKRRRYGWAAVPLAAAAVVALLLAQRSDEPVMENSQLIALMFRDEPVVTPPANKQAIIVENKDLTVVWLY